jgi:hypothetical protein
MKLSVIKFDNIAELFDIQLNATLPLMFKGRAGEGLSKYKGRPNLV